MVKLSNGCTLMKYYAGIGSRQTPEHILILMREVASKLYWKGWHLRSGGAVGADMAFWQGYVNDAKGKGLGTIYTPDDATPESITHASQYHPNWNACSSKARKLHGRNSLILLGDKLNIPVRFIVCWTPKAAVVGGTGQALRIASDPQYKIPVKNLANEETCLNVQKWLIDESPS